MTKYQGKNLACLVLAICLPAGLLYLRLVFGLIAGDSRIPAEQAARFLTWSTVALVLFFPVQIFCAGYVTRLLRPRQSKPGKALQYLGTLLLCIFFSITGAIMLEAFGLNVFLRMAGAR